jgi:hypothetical protein
METKAQLAEVFLFLSFFHLDGIFPAANLLRLLQNIWFGTVACICCFTQELRAKNAHIITEENKKKHFKDGVTGPSNFVLADSFPSPSAFFWCSRKRIQL